ncbi:DoxX family protein [Candidatus Neomarinimicrobiota bacterium]
MQNILSELQPLKEPKPGWPTWSGWPILLIRMILGGMFIASGSFKIMDAQTFMDTLPLYHVPAWMVPFGALVPTVEVGLGIALVLGSAIRPVLMVTGAMLVAFSIMLIGGIIGGDLDSCGCFGAYFETSPQLALARNVLMLLGCYWIWKYNEGYSSSWPVWQSFTGMALFLVLGTYTGAALGIDEDIQSADMIGAFFPDEGILDENAEIDGDQLIYLFAVNCEHCWNAVANVKELAAHSGIEVVGLTPSPKYEIKRFFREFAIEIPVYQYDQQLFYDNFPTWPAIYYLHDGVIAGYTSEVPSLKTLREVHFLEWD